MATKDRRQETWKAADVRCPFYTKDSLSNIECEGVLEDTTDVTCFQSHASKNHHMGVFCAGRFESCAKHQSVMHSKYAE